VNFPFSLIQGSAAEWGIAARQALAKFDNSLLFLGRNRQGQTQVLQLSGHNAVRISNHELESRFEGYPTVADATAFSYMLDGHAMFQINFPSAEESWLYDGASSAVLGVPVWSQVQSAGLGRQRVERVVVYQNRLIGADSQSGKLYALSHDTYTEAGDPIIARVRTRHFFEDNQEVSIAQVWLDAETGVGIGSPTAEELLGDGVDPHVMFRYSKNHGHTWSAELWRRLGSAGQYLTRCYWNRLGASRDWVFEWTISAPVKVALMNAGLKTISAKKQVVL
jgi:hypothetical protein